MGNETEKLQKEITELKAENNSLTQAQQGLKSKIKELTESPPKITSRHKAGSVKYIRQKRI